MSSFVIPGNSPVAFSPNPLHNTLMMPLATYIHDLNPFIFRFTDTFGPRWYGMAYLLGFLAAYILLVRLAKQGLLRMPQDRVADMVLHCCIFGVLLGGRLGYVLFYDLPTALHEGLTPLLWKFSANFPYWGVLEVWQGGMSAHGGIVVTCIAVYIFARRNKYSFANLADASCMVVPLGLLFGRIANFINGELYGDPTTVSWAVKFPTEITSPTNGKIYDDLAVKVQDQVIPVVNNFIEQQTQIVDKLKDSHQLVELIQRLLPMPGVASDKYAAMSTFAKDTLGEVLPARHPSQLYEGFLEGLVLFVICWLIGRYWRRQGMAAGAFLVLYPVMRTIGELFRVGDTPINVGGVLLSRGILYSIPVFFFGVGYCFYWLRQPTPTPASPAQTP
jgi:phosphatidylglycerol---prolipoprotein diacylglyceryl transferase